MILFLLAGFSALSQVDDPCADFPNGYTNLTPNALATQSSTDGGNLASFAIDGNTGGTSLAITQDEGNAWLDIELSSPSYMHEMAIWFPSGQPLGNAYALFSAIPFQSENLAQELVNEENEYLYLQGVQSGATIPVNITGVQYIRIQNENGGILSLFEVEIPGATEDCGNGTDDDCDGLVDCDDPDCSGIFNTTGHTAVDPTCPICEDGEIYLHGTAFNQITLPNGTTKYNLTEYSIDDGQTWQGTPDFYNLDEGHYYGWLKNPVTGCLLENPKNPIILEAREGDRQGECPNGDFEEGDFSGWTGGMGSYEEDEIKIDNTDFDDPTLSGSVHRILPSGQSDPHIPDLSLTSPSGGGYIARLGNDNTFPNGADAAKLTYCFIVDDDNKNLHFNFALVLQNPGDDHSKGEKPRFRYRLSVDGQSEVEENFYSDDDDFFQPYSWYSYRDWTCRNIDLSSHLGKEACLEFIVTDCSKGDHHGYAYIDGVCTDADDQVPEGIIETERILCVGADNYLINGSNSYGENQYTWEVCKIDASGNEFDCAARSFKGSVGELDIKEFLESTGHNFVIDQYYRIKLRVWNDCAYGIPVEEDIYVNSDLNIDYYDVTYCTSGATPVVGVNDCTTCTYEWVALTGDPIAVDDPTAAFPNVINFPMGSGAREVAVTVTDDVTGCIYKDTVKVVKFSHEPIVTLTYIDESSCASGTNCDLIFFAEIETELDFEQLFIEFKNETNGTVFENMELTSSEMAVFPEFVNRYKLRYVLNGYEEGVMDESTYKIIVGFEEYMNFYNIGCVAEDEVVIGDLDSWGDIPLMFFPNAFSPNGDGTNDLWVIEPPSSGYEVTWYKLQIWGSWGSLLYEKEECSLNGFPIGSINWDGNDSNGDPLGVDWYIYLLNFENCNNKRAKKPKFPLQQSNHPCPGEPENCWYGEVYLIR